MDIHLTPDLEQMVLNKLQAGHYGSASDVVSEALRRMQQQDLFEDFEKKEIGDKIEAGLKSLREGKGLDGDAVFDRLEAEFDALERAAKV